MEKPKIAGNIEQLVSVEDIQALIVNGDFLRAQAWSKARISYLESVIRELPKSEDELETTNIASWRKMRAALLEELHIWRDKLAYIESLIAKM